MKVFAVSNMNFTVIHGLFVDPTKRQPRPQGFSLKKWVGREKALASAGHVSPCTP